MGGSGRDLLEKEEIKLNDLIFMANQKLKIKKRKKRKKKASAFWSTSVTNPCPKEGT